jgi:hypothetical protein
MSFSNYSDQQSAAFVIGEFRWNDVPRNRPIGDEPVDFVYPAHPLGTEIWFHPT